MQVSPTSKRDSRWISRVVIAIAVVALLAIAAYVWGDGLRADTQQSFTQNSSSAASRYGAALGVSAVRAADAAVSQRSSLRGVAAVRTIDQGVRSTDELRQGAAAQALSTLELWRSRGQIPAEETNSGAQRTGSTRSEERHAPGGGR